MDDLISRWKAIIVTEWAMSDSPSITRKDWNAVVESLRGLPSAELRGRWEDIEHAPDGLLYVTCSVCGKRQTVEFTNYCGNCGAKMVNEDE